MKIDIRQSLAADDVEGYDTFLELLTLAGRWLLLALIESSIFCYKDKKLQLNSKSSFYPIVANSTWQHYNEFDVVAFCVIDRAFLVDRPCGANRVDGNRLQLTGWWDARGI